MRTHGRADGFDDLHAGIRLAKETGAAVVSAWGVVGSSYAVMKMIGA
jgi:hypothetical protein